MANYSLDLEASSSQYGYKNTPSGMPTSTTLTLEAWVKLESAPSNSAYQIISKNDANTANQDFGIAYQDDLGTKRFLFQARYQYILNYTLSTGTWYHIAAVKNNGDYEIFVDGSSIGTTSQAGSSLLNDGDNLYIGTLGTSARYFDGLIDEVRIWNTARTSTQINANKNTELVGNEAGLVAYYKFNEGTGTSVNDETANNNDLTLSGSPAWSTSVPFNIYTLAITAVSFALTGVNNILGLGRNFVCSVGTFTLTGINNIFKRGWGMIATTRNFILTGYNVLLDVTGWTERTKPSTSWANRTKPSTTFTDRTKPTTTWTKVDRF